MKTFIKSGIIAGLFTFGSALASQAQTTTVPIQINTTSLYPLTINRTLDPTAKSEIRFQRQGITRASFGHDIFNNGSSNLYFQDHLNSKVRLFIGENGIGINTTSPYPSGIHLADPQDWGVSLWLDATSKNGKIWALQSGANWHNAGAGGFSIRNETNGTDALLIDGTTSLVKIPEKLLIGTLKPQAPHTDFKLGVQGKLVAQSIYVTNVSAWADYVFADDYSLTPLSEVEAYVKENKHLPEVPSAAEVMDQGFDVAKMDALLLKKIEELTLHMIEMQKQNEQLKTRIQTLEGK